MGHEKPADVIWRGFDVICVCPSDVSPLIDHDQQTMKKHTEWYMVWRWRLMQIASTWLNLNYCVVYMYCTPTFPIHTTPVFKITFSKCIFTCCHRTGGTYTKLASSPCPKTFAVTCTNVKRLLAITEIFLK